jgi:hypothetical protein
LTLSATILRLAPSPASRLRRSAAAIAAAALEPDSPGSFIGTGILAVLAGTNEAPIYRAHAAAAHSLRLMPVPGAANGVCELP